MFGECCYEFGEKVQRLEGVRMEIIKFLEKVRSIWCTFIISTAYTEFLKVKGIGGRQTLGFTMC